MEEQITQLIPSNILDTDITDEMQRAYLDYAMSVIVSRALPDVRDGLKPVHRRIIYAMQDQGMTASGKFNKCAAVIGEVMKKYHPHGDVGIYDALVRMGQDFTLRYPLIIPQGNFGSMDGDPPAAMRYTECKLHKISEELYSDIDKETVDFELNDLQNYEPIYLPSLLPNLLLNGSAGIAVGMATNIPPHNLSEIIDGIDHLIERADHIGDEPDPEKKVEIFEGFAVKVANTGFSSEANVEDLIKLIKGPDFPTGGIIYDQSEIIQMYATGKGKIVTRAKTTIETSKGGKVSIIATEIPYQVNKSTLLSKIADLVKNKRIEGISDLRDESNKEGVRVVVELKRDAIAKKVQNQLFRYTPLQNTFNANMVALVDREPKLMTLKMILEEFIKHRQKVVVRRTIFLLKKVKEREHILQGLKIAIDNIDAVIKLIRASKDAETAKKGLIEKFKLSEIQAQAILDMQLRKLAALERQKIEDELSQITETIKDFESLLISPKKIIEKVRKELSAIKERYGDVRKTQVIKGKVGEFNEEDLIANEKCIVTISENGYIKRFKEDAYRKQGRGGTGKTGQALKEGDRVDTIKICDTHDWAFFFTNTGKVYRLRIWELPEALRTAKGTPVVNFLSIAQSEKVEAFFTLGNGDAESKDACVFFVTKNGRVKKALLKDFSNIRSSGIIAIKLDSGDSLVFAGYVEKGDEVLITTSKGQSIRFRGSQVRAMGRTAGGVSGIRLSRENDYVIGATIIDNKNKETDLLTISEHGYGKKTHVDEYKVQNRGGSGIRTHMVTNKTGFLVSARTIAHGQEIDILIATETGNMIRLSSKQIPTLGRSTQGVRLIRVPEGDKVISMTPIIEKSSNAND